MPLLLNWLESLYEEMKISEKCLRVRNRKSTCVSCLEHCKHEAIDYKDHLLTINPEQCTLCGECTIACPLSAIEGLVVNRKFEKGSLLFDDSYTPSIKELLIYHKRGVSSIQANHNPLNLEWETVLEETNEQLTLLAESGIKVVKKISDEKLSRRAFFSSFQKEGKNLIKGIAPVSWKIEVNGWNLSKYYPDYQFFSVEINKDECTLCQSCFSLCPQEVFTLKDSMLQIENEKCVNCPSCTDVCPENAIQIKPEIKEKSDNCEVFHTKQCQDCGQSFYTFLPEIEKCHVCSNRDPNWLTPY